MPSLRTTLAVLLLPAALACGQEAEVTVAPEPGDPTVATPTAEPEDIGTVLAEVDGVVIGSKEFEIAAARKTPARGDTLTEEQKKEILDELVTEKMLYLEAKKRGIDLDPKVQKVMVNTLLRDDVYSGVRNSDFSDDDLRKYYEEHKAEFVVPAKVQVRRIFVKSSGSRTPEEALTLITELHAKVVADPTTFKDVASESSEDPYRRRGGDLGYISKEGKPGIDDAVVAKAFELEVDQVSEPFEAGGGYNVVMVTGKREEVERTFEQMKGSVLRKVKTDKYKELYDAYVAEIRPGYDVTLHEEALAAVEVKPSRRLSLGSGSAMGPGIEEAIGPGDDDEDLVEMPGDEE